LRTCPPGREADGQPPCALRNLMGKRRSRCEEAGRRQDATRARPERRSGQAVQGRDRRSRQRESTGTKRTGRGEKTALPGRGEGAEGERQERTGVGTRGQRMKAGDGREARARGGFLGGAERSPGDRREDRSGRAWARAERRTARADRTERDRGRGDIWPRSSEVRGERGKRERARIAEKKVGPAGRTSTGERRGQWAEAGRSAGRAGEARSWELEHAPASRRRQRKPGEETGRGAFSSAYAFSKAARSFTKSSYGPVTRWGRCGQPGSPLREGVGSRSGEGRSCCDRRSPHKPPAYGLPASTVRTSANLGPSSDVMRVNSFEHFVRVFCCRHVACPAATTQVRCADTPGPTGRKGRRPDEAAGGRPGRRAERRPARRACREAVAGTRRRRVGDTVRRTGRREGRGGVADRSGERPGRRAPGRPGRQPGTQARGRAGGQAGGRAAGHAGGRQGGRVACRGSGGRRLCPGSGA
jgi:hypothetical protein